MEVGKNRIKGQRGALYFRDGETIEAIKRTGVLEQVQFQVCETLQDRMGPMAHGVH